jgi:hypothetical protein
MERWIKSGKYEGCAERLVQPVVAADHLRLQLNGKLLGVNYSTWPLRS